jgi:hypothetical protein
MDRMSWLSLLVVGLAVALLLTSRAALDGADFVNGATLQAEVQALDGEPSTKELADRVTGAAGCVYGYRPRLQTCWYAWAHPERPAYLEIIATRVMADSGGSALGYAFASLPFWLLALVSGWKASRWRPPASPVRLTPRIEPAPRTPGRLMS